jgi:hypothetical protein
MAATIDATVGGASANSYCTLVEANAYHDTRLQSTSWDDASNDQRNRALITATSLLDEHLEWGGNAVDEDQALCWPRSEMYDRNGNAIDDDAIPSKLKAATAEFARLLIDADRMADTTEGIAAASVGSIEVQFDAANPAPRKVVPEAVYEMVKLWVEGSPYGSGGVVPLVRA